MAVDTLTASARWRWVLAALVVCVCWLAFDPNPPPRVTTGWDKSNHALAFAVLALAACRAFPGRRWAIAAGLLAFGVFIEAVQSQIPGRSAEALDVVADLVGFAPLLLMRRRAA